MCIAIILVAMDCVSTDSFVVQMMNRGTIMDNLSVLSVDDIDIDIKYEEQDQYIFKISKYIPNKYRYKCLFYAVGCLVIALGIIITVTMFSIRNHGTAIGKAEIPSIFGGKLILLTNSSKILSLDPKTNDLKNIETSKSKNSVMSFDIHLDGRIYWSENDTSRLAYILTTNNNSNILLEDSRLKPNGLALDRVADNLYVIDEDAGILVINIRLKHHSLLVSDLTKPCDIVLDSEEGFMFILQSGKSIVRTNMDGTNLVTIVKNIGITALTLDSNQKRLYWISEFVNIESSNYNGTNRQSFFSDTVTIASLAILHERIYWLWPSHGHLTSLLSCEISKNDTCHDYKIHDIDQIANAKLIKSYSNSDKLINNPCTIKNGGCQQLCLISGKNRRSCSCGIGWKLNSDRRSCRKAREFVLYPHDNVIRASSLDGSADLIWPTPYKVQSLKIKKEIDFDYDWNNDNFFFSDDHHIYRIKLRKACNQTEILDSSNDGMIIEDIAYDWRTSNIYYVQRSINGSKEQSIVLMNMRLGEKYRKTIMTVINALPVGTKRCPYSLALHPNEGYIVYACELDGPPIIQQLSMNGTSVYRYEHPFLPLSYGHILSLDYYENSIYWISFSIDMTFVEHVKLNSPYSSSMTIEGITRAEAIQVFEKWLFISNSTSIWRVNKDTGKDVVKIVPKLIDNTKKIAGLKIISEAMQFNDDDDVCMVNNGGCEQFCFAGVAATCDCKDGQTAGNDGQCT